MLPVARCQTHVAFTSGQAGVELSFKKIVRWSTEVETDARRNVGENLILATGLSRRTGTLHTRPLEFSFAKC
jgi:hypothetical protein